MEIASLNYRSLRGSIRRLFRTLVFFTVDLGVMDRLAAFVSVFDRQQGLYLRGRVLTIARRNEDHTDYWLSVSRQFPASSTIVRQSVHAALRSGKIGDAEAGLKRLVAVHRTQSADCNFVLGLVFVLHRRAALPEARKLIRQFFASLRGKPDYRIAALRLSRVIVVCFARKHADDPAAAQRRNLRHLRRLIDRAGLPSEPRLLLERVVRLEEVLGTPPNLALLDTDISPQQCREFVQIVRARLDAKEPFSFVRVGDGEAACLPYEPGLSWLEKGDAIERERIWWGEPLNDSQRRRLNRLVFNAVWSADCIGIPTISRFLREARLGENDRLDRGLTGRGLRSILYCTERFATFRASNAPQPVFTSCHLHQELARWDLYSELLGGVTGVVLLSCHPGLADFVQTRFGATVSSSIVLPPDMVSAPLLKQRSTESRSLPQIVDEVAAELAQVARGKLVLVGAGYLGKWLVDVARTAGGVALDVGSVFDYWLGLTTRSYLDLNSV